MDKKRLVTWFARGELTAHRHEPSFLRLQFLLLLCRVLLSQGGIVCTWRWCCHSLSLYSAGGWANNLPGDTLQWHCSEFDTVKVACTKAANMFDLSRTEWSKNIGLWGRCCVATGMDLTAGTLANARHKAHASMNGGAGARRSNETGMSTCTALLVRQLLRGSANRGQQCWKPGRQKNC